MKVLSLGGRERLESMNVPPPAEHMVLTCSVFSGAQPWLVGTGREGYPRWVKGMGMTDL